MNWLDVVVVLWVGIRAWSGYRRGLVRQFFDLVGLIVGLFLALGHYYSLQQSLQSYLPFSLPVLAGMAFLAILFAVIFLARLMGQIFTKLLGLPGLGLINAASGAAVAMLATLIMFSFIFGVVNLFAISPVEGILAGSFLAPYLEEMAPRLLAMVEEYIPWKAVNIPSGPGAGFLEGAKL
jgi:membrane protein required for colicin V production